MSNEYPWNEGLTETEQQRLLLIGKLASDKNRGKVLCLFAEIRFGPPPRTSASKKTYQQRFAE